MPPPPATVHGPPSPVPRPPSPVPRTGAVPRSQARGYLPRVSVATPSSDRVEAAATPHFRTVFGDLAALTKPGITRLVVFTTAAGYLMALGTDASLVRLLHTVFGAAFASAGANALNMWWERDTDAHMKRTHMRPLPAGRISPKVALLFAILLSAWGLLHLVLFVNLPTVGLVAASLLSYILVYTPLKRRTHHATLIGALPGSLPTLAGWTAASLPIGAAALALTAVVFFWQMPHFYALAWVYREDYARGGMRMLTVIDPEGSRLGLESFAYSVLLLVVSLVPVTTGLIGWVYGTGAVILGLVMIVFAARLWAHRDDQRAWHLFFASITYLPVLLALMLLDRFMV